MQFKSTNPSYTHRFLGHFRRFIEEYSLFEREDALLVAVSGGIDSMAVLYALVNLRNFGYSNELRVVHINHATRPGQDAEADMVKEYCKHLGVAFLSETLSDLDPHRNFEYHARQKRYDVFYKLANNNEKIVLAHHIDDSFEWTMLQSLRSSSIEGLIGIPLVNDRVIRPFMCVTKAQIRRFAQYLDLPYLEDPTNELMKYERNFIRGEVIPAFADRYKKYLKHYVYRHNEIARRLGLHQIYKQTSAYQMNFGEDGVLIYSISNQKEYSGLGELILKGLKHLNPQGRGVVSKQLAKIEEAMQNDKYGPLSLTGGVKVYLDFNLILLTQKKAPALNFNLGEFETYSFDEYHDFLTEYFDREDNQMSFPFWVIIKGPKLDKRNFQTNFGVDAVSEFRKRGLLYYPALKLWREWSKKKNRHKVLRLFFVDR